MKRLHYWCPECGREYSLFPRELAIAENAGMCRDCRDEMGLLEDEEENQEEE